ncbi:BnaCnng71960D [Brassica napus]|uniref:BnaCnng71960D protein n=2 Tax=Brassica napus TaxID=3708 RepID=A0A078JUJ0_BRANA|nr:BnaCnng71960D [Brassica napus]
MFVKKPWKWTMDCWEVTGTWVNIEPAVVSPAKKKVVKEDSPRPRKKAPAEASEEVHTTVGGLTKEDIKTMFKDIVDAMREGFGTCLKEIKYLSERVEVVEKKSESVNGTNAEGRAYRRIKVQMCPQMLVPRKIKLQNRALRMLDIWKRGMLLWHFAVQRVIEQGNLLPHSYNPFAPIDKKKLKQLADWLKTCPHYRTPLDKKPRTSRTWWYQILRTSLEWLEDCTCTIFYMQHIDVWINVLRKRYEANPQHFRSERKCFLDHLFSQQWRFNYKDFKGSEPDQNGLGRRLPSGRGIIMQALYHHFAN